MVKKLDAIKIYEIAESGNTGQKRAINGNRNMLAATNAKQWTNEKIYDQYTQLVFLKYLQG